MAKIQGASLDASGCDGVAGILPWGGGADRVAMGCAWMGGRVILGYQLPGVGWGEYKARYFGGGVWRI